MRDRSTIIKQILTICQEPTIKWSIIRQLETSWSAATTHIKWLFKHDHVELAPGRNYVITSKGRDLLRALEKVEELMA